MNTAILAVSAIALYLVAAGGFGLGVLRAHGAPPATLRMHFALAAAATLLHAGLLYQNIFTDQGLDVGVFNAASLVGWIVVIILLGASLVRSVHTLLATLLPVAALAIGLELTFASERIVPDQAPKGIDLHIALSLLAYSVLTIAALQAILLAIADYQLRHKRPLKVMRALPPLATMETLLFQLIGVGVFLLTLGLISGILFVENLFAQHLLHKTVLSLLAWFVFAFLLWGRRYRGWRGRTAVRFTISGFVLLALGFFGSEVVLQLILHRV